MNNVSKREKAQILLNAMSEIDDAYLNEALSYTPAGKKSKLLRFQGAPVRIVSSVAAAAAVVALILTGPMRGMLKKSESERPENSEAEIGTPARDTSSAALNSLLEACAQSEQFQVVSYDEINFFDGSVRLAVQNLDTQELYLSQPLSAAQQATAQRSLSSTHRTLSETFSENRYAVWVTLGNGRVETPCLIPSAGNTGAAELFRYEAERLPSSDFFTLLEALTS